MRIQSLTGTWEFRRAGEQEWLPANVPGGVFWDPEADAAFLDALRADLRSDIPIIIVEDHVNSISFADRVADEFLKLMTV